MKKLIGIIGVVLVATVIHAGSITEMISDFFGGNPTNSWDLSTYAVNNLQSSIKTEAKPDNSVAHGWGGGVRAGYWLNPTVGTTLDVSYCDSQWTFASLSLTARGTITLGNLGTVSPYVMAGPGYSLAYDEDSVLQQNVVVFAGGGATLHINKLKAFDLFAEYVTATTQPERQDRVQFGVTKRF